MQPVASVHRGSGSRGADSAVREIADDRPGRGLVTSPREAVSAAVSQPPTPATHTLTPLRPVCCLSGSWAHQIPRSDQCH